MEDDADEHADAWHTLAGIPLTAVAVAAAVAAVTSKPCDVVAS